MATATGIAIAGATIIDTIDRSRRVFFLPFLRERRLFRLSLT
jgi:hypothetical protein